MHQFDLRLYSRLVRWLHRQAGISGEPEEASAFLFCLQSHTAANHLYNALCLLEVHPQQSPEQRVHRLCRKGIVLIALSAHRAFLSFDKPQHQEVDYLPSVVVKEATRNKCIATRNKCLTSSNKKLLLVKAVGGRRSKMLFFSGPLPFCQELCCPPWPVGCPWPLALLPGFLAQCCLSRSCGAGPVFERSDGSKQQSCIKSSLSESKT